MIFGEVSDGRAGEWEVVVGMFGSSFPAGDGRGWIVVGGGRSLMRVDGGVGGESCGSRRMNLGWGDSDRGLSLTKHDFVDVQMVGW